jgi:hypothetical protein
MVWVNGLTVWVETDYDRWQRLIHSALFDPNRTEETRAKNLAEHPNYYR